MSRSENKVLKVNMLQNTSGFSNQFTFKFISTGTRIRTQIEGFGDLYSTIELCPYKSH